MSKNNYKVDPRSIHVDQRKTDSRRDAWDRDYMPADWVKPQPQTNKQIENAKSLFFFIFIFALFM